MLTEAFLSAIAPATPARAMGFGNLGRTPPSPASPAPASAASASSPPASAASSAPASGNLNPLSRCRSRLSSLRRLLARGLRHQIDRDRGDLVEVAGRRGGRLAEQGEQPEPRTERTHRQVKQRRDDDPAPQAAASDRVLFAAPLGLGSHAFHHTFR